MLISQMQKPDLTGFQPVFERSRALGQSSIVTIGPAISAPAAERQPVANWSVPTPLVGGAQVATLAPTVPQWAEDALLVPLNTAQFIQLTDNHTLVQPMLASLLAGSDNASVRVSRIPGAFQVHGYAATKLPVTDDLLHQLPSCAGDVAAASKLLGQLYPDLNPGLLGPVDVLGCVAAGVEFWQALKKKDIPDIVVKGTVAISATAGLIADFVPPAQPLKPQVMTFGLVCKFGDKCWAIYKKLTRAEQAQADAALRAVSGPASQNVNVNSPAMQPPTLFRPLLGDVAFKPLNP